MVSSMGKHSQHRIEVSCCVCGATWEVRSALVKDYTHLMCAQHRRQGGRPDVPQRPGMVLVHTYDVAGYFDGFTYRIADVEERASLDRASALARITQRETGGRSG